MKYLSLITMFLSFGVLGQISKVEIKQIKDIKLSADSTYSRSIKVQDSILYAAMSNGNLYIYNFRTAKIKEVLGHEVEELRDLEILANGNILAMMSGSTGKFVSVGPGRRTATHDVSIMDSVFLDAMDFTKGGVGAMMGDPIDGKFSLYFTNSFGASWNIIYPKIEAKDGEAGFAASGTILQMIDERLFYFASGGMDSRLFKIDLNDFDDAIVEIKDIPMEKGASKGVYSIYFKNEKEGIVVGGDYTLPEDNTSACYYTLDGGETWLTPDKSVNGYRSCVVYNKEKNVLFASGKNGVDYSLDFGKTWLKLTDEPMFALTFFKENLLGTARSGIIKQIELKFYLK